MNITAICPGSFDPITLGHLDIIRRAAVMFARVIVLVTLNPEKTPCFSAEERADMIKKTVADIPNVSVEIYGGLLAAYAKKAGAKAIVKGLRALTDFEYEFQMALTNKKLYPQADTVFLAAEAENMYLSSGMVRTVGKMGGDISDFVPTVLCEYVQERLAGRKM